MRASVVRPARRLAAVAAAVVLAGGLAATAANAAGPSGPDIASTVHYAVNKPLCATPSDPHRLRCFAMERVNVPKGTPGAYPYSLRSDIVWGPSGGYTPALLASIYHYNPDRTTTGQLVGIVDWYNDPDVRAELNTFDSYYRLPHETSTSFRVVNQNGKSSPLPQNDTGSAGEIALDVQAVRGVCQTCRILLVEANGPSLGDTAAAVNTAVRLGATEVSNSYGAPVAPTSSTVLSGYNHPGTVITASTGDQGWFGWTDANSNTDPNAHAANSAYFPSSDPTVVGIGGTRLYVDTNTGLRSAEYVWNDEQVADQAWIQDAVNEGGTGGGCSHRYTAKTWQTHTANYSGLGCGGKRSAADISAVGDPESGYSVYLQYGGNGWTTIGGTSLSSPVIAAMYALAGGARGAAYPASTLYVNAQLRSSTVFDITNPGPQFDTAGGFIAGGNSWCAGDTISDCESVTNTELGVQNPNTYSSNDYFDCSFPRTGLPTGTTLSPQCNAVTGFDGPSGLGAPKGLGVFARTAPGLAITRPSAPRPNHPAYFKATVTEVIAGAHPTKYTWTWGDGHSTSVSSTSSSIKTAHTYTKAGTCKVTLSVYDSLHQQVIKKTRVTIG